MSAFIVSDNLVNDCLNFISNNMESHIDIFNLFKRKKHEELNKKFANLLRSEKLNYIGNYILENNYLSVNFRYNQNEKAHDFNFKPSYKSISIAQFLKNIDCIDYQSCEVDNYYQSEFYYFLNRLKQFAIYRIDGYDQAQWGY
jgi:hypothetical protein